MHGDFGYMEEGKLGKPYNIRLLKRLGRYAVPYRIFIFFSLVIAITVTLLDLVLPYLTKVAIDRYILASWYKVELSGEKQNIINEISDKYPNIILLSKDGKIGLISNSDLQKIDPHDLAKYRRRGLITDERFYRSFLDERELISELGDEERIEMADGSIALSLKKIQSLSPENIIRIRSNDIRGLVMISVFLMCVLFLSFGMNYGEFYLLEYIGQNIMQDVRLDLFSKIQGRALSFFDRHPVGRLVTRVTNDIENLNEMFKSVLVTFFKDVFILTGILSILLYLNWRLALVSFIILPFIFGFTIIFSALMREAFRSLREKVSKLNSFQQERIANMWIIQLFAKEKYQMDNFSRLNHENYLAGMGQLRLFAIFVPFMELISAVGVALVIWYGGIKVLGEQLSLGSLVAFISYIQMFFRPIRDISEKYNIMQLAMASTERIFEFMDKGEEIPDPVSPEQSGNTEGRLEFRYVHFSYEEGNPVLKDVNFVIKPGEMVAVVGATGAGKSTLVNLIERFYDPDEGTVTLDGMDIREITKDELRSNIGLVMQDVFIFSGNVINNISLGREDISIDDIDRASEEANAKWFIDKLPGGLYHELSEGGTTLSGGERQLLSFARALAYRPKILILDEATSSVDPETERLIQEAINRMTSNRTTLVVAHRLSTIRKADRIIVMHHGRIREQGNHDELMAIKGIYYKLNLFREYLHE